MKKDSLDQALDQLLVGTSEYGDEELPQALLAVLSALRAEFNMDVVFVSRIADGRRTFVAVDAAPEHDLISPGMSDPVEQSWCHNIVQGRLPELIRDGRELIRAGAAPWTPLEIGTHLSVPVRSPDGRVHGTLCTFAFHVDEKVSDEDIRRLRRAADVIGTRLTP